MSDVISLLLTGDVMTGRGIDQILAQPGDPTLHETWVKSALRYVDLAEDRCGEIPRRVAPDYIWGDIIEVFADPTVTARVVNLETAVTDRGLPWADKGIHYRMHPANVSSLTAAGIEVVTLANNHVMDWSEPGLEQTLEALASAGIATTGAGLDERRAWRPARVGPVLVLGMGTPSSGIPYAWAAAEDRPGVALLPDLSERTVERVASLISEHTRAGDVVVASIHWGSNWGYYVPEGHRRFARGLIDRAGVHLVHGHSSHHPLGMELYREHLILYGCGDLLTDYEGISGYEAYRGNLGAVYRAHLRSGSGTLIGLDLVPTRVHRFRLTRPIREEVEWLAEVLRRESEGMAIRIEEGSIRVGW